MKRVVCLVASLVFLVNIEAQYAIKKNLGNFNGIEISSAQHVNLIQSDSNYVIVSAKDSIKKVPKVEVREGILEISSSFKGAIELHFKNINSIKVSDAARVECKDTLKTDNLSVNVSDAASADIWVNAKNIMAKVDDAGSLTFGGSADSLNVKASDASHINTKYLRAGSVNAVSTDGSNITVLALKSIDANATDGSNIHIIGNPVQKNTSSSDGGSIKMEYTEDPVTPRNHDINIVEMDTDFNGKKKLVVTGDAFIGGGFITGGTQLGAPVKYGSSREFIVGFGSGHMFTKWNEIGFDVYYKSTDFYLSEDSAKTFPNKTLHNQEKISFQNFGGLVFDRFYFGTHIFLDGGVYGDWAFHSKYITWNDNTPNASSTKTIQRNLGFVNPLDYGLTFRFGSTEGLSLYFNYRLSNYFQNTSGSEPAYPKLPAYVIGINIGGF